MVVTRVVKMGDPVLKGLALAGLGFFRAGSKKSDLIWTRELLLSSVLDVFWVIREFLIKKIKIP